MQIIGSTQKLQQNLTLYWYATIKKYLDEKIRLLGYQSTLQVAIKTTASGIIAKAVLDNSSALVWLKMNVLDMESELSKILNTNVQLSLKRL